jgi:hypothetical protein
MAFKPGSESKSHHDSFAAAVKQTADIISDNNRFKLFSGKYAVDSPGRREVKNLLLTFSDLYVKLIVESGILTGGFRALRNLESVKDVCAVKRG